MAWDRFGARQARAGACVSILALAAVAPMVLAQPAWAQSAPAAPKGSSDGQTVGEVVVTAQFRAQKLQDTPIAITAINSQMLEARNQTNVTEIARQAPNVQITPAGQLFGPAAQVFIRGIGQSDTSYALEPGVGMYVDDVYYSTLLSTAFELVDLDRIEILRGPQGTLAGKNSIGGAVKLYSKKPDGEGGGYLEAGYGTRNHVRLRGAIDFPMVPDKLFFRVSGLAERQTGYMKRLDYGCLFPGSGVPVYQTSSNCLLGHEGGQDVLAARAQLRWLPTEAIEVNLSADVTEDNSGPAASALLYGNRSDTFLNGVHYDSKFVPSNPYVTYSTYADPGGIYHTPFGTLVTQPGYSVAPIGTVHDWGFSGVVDWKLSDSLSLKSITGYRRYRIEYTQDADESPFDFQTVDNLQQHRQVSEELRLNGSSFGKALEWTVGGFYFDARSIVGGRVQFPGQFDILLNDPVVTKNKSGFAQAIWHITDSLNLTGGIRYTDESKDYTFSRIDPNTGAPPPSLAPIHGRTATSRDSRWDYSVSVDYRFSPALMAYARWATGFRSGGINPRPFAANQVVPFGAESLNSYEAGFKSDLLDRRLRFNATGFLSKYNNMVLSTFQPYFNPNLPVCNDPSSTTCIYNPTQGTFPGVVPVNGGKATLYGAEFEAEAHPAAGLTIDGTLSYIHFQLDEIPPAAATGGYTLNSKLPFTPTWKASLGVQYEIPLAVGGSLTPRLDVTYQSKVIDGSNPTTWNTIDPYALLNARLTWRQSNGDWEASLAVTNLADKLYYYNKTDLTALGGTAIGTPAPPREWLVSVMRRF
jgi:iron complex outermembrane receptor protein